MRRFQDGGAAEAKSIPQNQLLQLSQLIGGGQGGLFGSTTTRKSSGKANAYTDSLMQALLPQITGTSQADAVVKNIFDRAKISFAPVLGMERQAGLYNSSTRSLLANDAMGRAAGESAEAVLKSQQQAASTAANLSNEYMRSNTVASTPGILSNPLNLAMIAGGGLILDKLKGKKTKAKTPATPKSPAADSSAVTDTQEISGASDTSIVQDAQSPAEAFPLNMDAGPELVGAGADLGGFDINAQGADIGFDLIDEASSAFGEAFGFDGGFDINVQGADIGFDFADDLAGGLVEDIGGFFEGGGDFIDDLAGLFFADGGKVGRKGYANGGKVRNFANGGMYDIFGGSGYDAKYNPKPEAAKTRPTRRTSSSSKLTDGNDKQSLTDILGFGGGFGGGEGGAGTGFGGTAGGTSPASGLSAAQAGQNADMGLAFASTLGGAVLSGVLGPLSLIGFLAKAAMAESKAQDAQAQFNALVAAPVDAEANPVTDYSEGITATAINSEGVTVNAVTDFSEGITATALDGAGDAGAGLSFGSDAGTGISGGSDAGTGPGGDLNDGGSIKGKGTGTSDSIPAVNKSTGEKLAVSNGEYIIPADVVKIFGENFFDRLLDAYHTPVRS